MKPTQYADIDNLLADLLRAIQKVLGEKLVGLYLYGSLTWGDFDYESSDIDLLVATKTDIDEKEFEKLDEAQKELAKKYKHAREGMLEIAYMSVHALQTFKIETSKIAIMSPGEPFHIKDAGKDWLMNWYFVREKGITLFGKDPKEIIAPISKGEFIQAIKDHALLWRDRINDMHQRPFQAYAILTMCRALYAYKNGNQTSKKQAAGWVEKQFPEWSSLVQNALNWRKEWREEKVDHDASFSETKKFVNFIIDQIEA